MSKYNVKLSQVESTVGQASMGQTEAAVSYPAYVGLDVHKETIAVAVAGAGRAAPVY